MSVRTGQIRRTHASAPVSSLYMGTMTQKLRNFHSATGFICRSTCLSFDHLPDIPIAAVEANIIAHAFFQAGGGEEHQLQVRSQRHKTIGVTGRNVQNGWPMRAEHKALGGKIRRWSLPVVEQNRADDGSARDGGDIFP